MRRILLFPVGLALLFVLASAAGVFYLLWSISEPVLALLTDPRRRTAATPRQCASHRAVDQPSEQGRRTPGGITANPEGGPARVNPFPAPVRPDVWRH